LSYGCHGTRLAHNSLRLGHKSLGLRSVKALEPRWPRVRLWPSASKTGEAWEELPIEDSELGQGRGHAGHEQQPQHGVGQHRRSGIQIQIHLPVEGRQHFIVAFCVTDPLLRNRVRQNTECTECTVAPTQYLERSRPLKRFAASCCPIFGTPCTLS
jgi:hypothetical protein